MKATVKLALLAAASIFAAAGVANADPFTTNIPPAQAEVTDPLYSGPLSTIIPAAPAPALPATHPIPDGIRNSTRTAIMNHMRSGAGASGGLPAGRPLMPQITAIVGGAVMAQVRIALLNSLSNDPTTNPKGVPSRMVPFN